MAEKTQDQRPTQKSIASKAGVSVGAVSRALANDPKIAADTRQRILSIATELGYTPDRAAQRLRTGKTQVINLILPPHDEIFGFGTSIIRGITRGLEGSGYHLVVTPDFGADDHGDVLTRIVKNKLADGVLFSRTEPNDPRVRYLSEANFPFVSHGRTELATPHAYVDYDNFGFAYEAALRMIQIGADKIAILLPPSTLTFRQHLLHGFMTAVRETGVAFEIIEGATLESSAEQIETAISDRFAKANRPNGLILPGEVSGLAALAAIQDLELTPEKDVRMVVKQTSGLFDLTRPKVGSIYEDLATAGFQMATLLRKRIDNAPIESLQYVQPISQAPNR
ncbi:MAG: LacI family transcriptional regulator [Pseudomonadota bacterium]|nr:LacI family transcriptional regulator [Pseudomonadota bacterium]